MTRRTTIIMMMRKVMMAKDRKGCSESSIRIVT